jgi:glycosyltransferase involved in cell wall biosynthesis
MRVLMISKALVVGLYQRKLELLAERGVDLLAITPPGWRDERGDMPLERAYTTGYTLDTLPIAHNGDFHLHFYRGLGPRLHQFQPDLVHIDEEPYNLAAWQALVHARRAGARTVAFSWQNLNRRYPPPFAWGERWALRRLNGLIAGTDSAATVWRAKGYRGPMAVIAQFGTDGDLFRPAQQRPDRPFTLGYFGRLVEEKGVRLLLEACAALAGEWRLLLLGGGPLRDELEQTARGLGIGARVAFHAQVASTDIPGWYQRIDALALPSLTRPNWKEQFGRVLVEAMASGVPVIGSDSGAIPGVIGAGGLVVPEGDAAALTHAIGRLRDEPGLRQTLAAQGRARALAEFSHAGVADQTVAFYRELLNHRGAETAEDVD